VLQTTARSNSKEEVLTEKKTPNAHMYCTKKPRTSHCGPSQKSTCFGSGRYGIGSVDTSNPSGSLPRQTPSQDHHLPAAPSSYTNPRHVPVVPYDRIWELLRRMWPHWRAGRLRSEWWPRRWTACQILGLSASSTWWMPSRALLSISGATADAERAGEEAWAWSIVFLVWVPEPRVKQAFSSLDGRFMY
jgi:hypothetical protein